MDIMYHVEGVARLVLAFVGGIACGVLTSKIMIYVIKKWRSRHE